MASWVLGFLTHRLSREKHKDARGYSALRSPAERAAFFQRPDITRFRSISRTTLRAISTPVTIPLRRQVDELGRMIFSSGPDHRLNVRVNLDRSGRQLSTHANFQFHAARPLRNARLTRVSADRNVRRDAYLWVDVDLCRCLLDAASTIVFHERR